MSTGMPVPDRELARRLLGTVPHRDRLPAGRLKPPVGLIPSPVRGMVRGKKKGLPAHCL